MNQIFLSLIPPILVLISAIKTKKIVNSFIIGILAGAFIASHFSIIDSIKLILYRFYNEIDIENIIYQKNSPDHFYTIVFLITLGILISLIKNIGGINAYSKILSNKLKSKKNVQFTSLLISSFLFIDDYLNSLITGSIMHPITDKFKIPRTKLAFLLDSMSAPLCLIIPSSSWTAFILSQIERSGLNTKKDPFAIYIESIPYISYPILFIVTAILVVKNNISYSYMLKQEEEAEKNNNLFTLNNDKEINDNKESNIKDFIITMAIFIISLISMLIYSGGYFENKNSIINAILNANIFLALSTSSLIALFISIAIYYFKDKLSIKDIYNISISGFNLMRNSLIIIILAWTFSAILKNDLHSGQYIAKILIKNFPIYIFPLMIFLTSFLISLTIGSTWGTINIILPIAISILNIILSKLNNDNFIYLTIGSLLSGSAAGCNLSSISDATILSSASANCSPIEHLKSQAPLIIPAIVYSLIAITTSSLLLYNNYNINPFIIILIMIILLDKTLKILNQKKRIEQ